MFNYQDLMTIIKAENPTYERFRKSSLHDLVELIHNSPGNVDGILRAASSVPQQKWRKYPRTKGWLIWKAAQVSRVIPRLPPIVAGREIQYRKKPFDNKGYIYRSVHPPLSTGIINRPEGFNWSIVVTFTLTSGADAANYVPYRTVKSVMRQTNGAIAAPSSDAVKAQTQAAAIHKDGPWFANVKRSGNKIVIWDEPGTTRSAEDALSSWQGYHPIRFCAIFQMFLYPLDDGIQTNDPRLKGNTVLTCIKGNKIPYSGIDFGVYMEKGADGQMTGDFSNNGRNFIAYLDQIDVCRPPRAGLPAPIPVRAPSWKSKPKKQGGKFADV